MRTVLSSGGGELPDGDNLVELIILVGVKQAEDSGPGRTGPGINHHIQAVERIAESLCMSDQRKFSLSTGRGTHTGLFRGVGDLFDACGIDLFTSWRNGEPVDPSILVTDNQAILVVHAHSYPGTLVFHGY